MKTKEKILDYVRKKPMSTAEEITGELRINYETVMASLITLKKKGKVKASDSWPPKYAIPPKKPIKGNNGQEFINYVDKLEREHDGLRAENNRLRGELNECRKKLARLAQRIIRENIYGSG